MEVDDDTLVFPKCGITVGDIKDVAKKAKNKRHAVELLGISVNMLYRKDLKKYGLYDLFGKTRRPEPVKVTPEQIKELANQGFIRRDVAHMLGISTGWLRVLIKRWDLYDEFTVRGGDAYRVTMKGYADL